MSIQASLVRRLDAGQSRRRVRERRGTGDGPTIQAHQRRGSYEKADRVRVRDAGRRHAGARRRGRGSRRRVRARRLDGALLARRHREELRRADEGRRRLPARSPHLCDTRRGLRADARGRSVRRPHEPAREVRGVTDAEGADVAQHHDHSRQRARRGARPEGAAGKEHPDGRQQPARPRSPGARPGRRAAPAPLPTDPGERQASAAGRGARQVRPDVRDPVSERCGGAPLRAPSLPTGALPPDVVLLPGSP
jgi:hypothetical protein